MFIAGIIHGDGVTCLGQRVAMFDGTDWYDMHMSGTGSGNTIKLYRGDVIVGGDVLYYPYPGYDSIKYIARFLGFPTSVQSSKNEKSFSISPNPASTSIQIHLPSNQPTTLSFFNLLGEKVREEKISGGEISIDVSELPPGMYVMSDENKIVGKFVKE